MELISYTHNKKYFDEKIRPLPHPNERNIELFSRHTKDQARFIKELNHFDLVITGEISEELKNCLLKIKNDILKLKIDYPDFYTASKTDKRGRLDFILAIIFHKNLPVTRYDMNNIGFWRYINLNFLIEEIRWRRYPSKDDEMYKVAKILFDHSLATENIQRNLFSLRYWLLGERLFDIDKKYFYLEKLHEKAIDTYPKGGFQDYIQYLLDTKLLSSQEYISKQIGKLTLLKDKPMSASEIIESFKRYNAFQNRSLSSCNEEVLNEEIIKLK